MYFIKEDITRNGIWKEMLEKSKKMITIINLKMRIKINAEGPS